MDNTKPFYKEPLVEIHHGDALEVLRKLPYLSVQTIMTSPPYWGFRDYKEDGQIGLEDHFNDYINKLLGVVDEIKDVLKNDGSFFLNISDTYSGSGMGFGAADRGYPKGRDGTVPPRPKILPAGGLIGIPWRLALAMIDSREWILENCIIWYKRNHMPEPVQGRFTKSYEFLFYFTKNHRNGHYFDLDSVREPQQQQSLERYKRQADFDKQGKLPDSKYSDAAIYPKGQQMRRLGRGSLTPEWFKEEAQDPQYQGKFTGMGEEAERFGSPRARTQRTGRKGNNPELGNRNFMPTKTSHYPEVTPRGGGHWLGGGINSPEGKERTKEREASGIGKNPGDTWTINTVSSPLPHYAAFPEELCVTPILSTSRPGDVILDPFCGSGTTLAVAKKLGRKAVGIDISEEFCEMSKKRVQSVSLPMSLEMAPDEQREDTDDEY